MMYPCILFLLLFSQHTPPFSISLLYSLLLSRSLLYLVLFYPTQIINETNRKSHRVLPIFSQFSPSPRFIPRFRH
ncbi:hypothetical protein GGI42DRAFT_320692 [Trichoderma sp. SZMC 28013]